MYESVVDEHAAAAPDWPAESRAAAAFLHDLAVRDRHRADRLWKFAKASQRVLQVPVVGRAAARVVDWLSRR